MADQIGFLVFFDSIADFNKTNTKFTYYKLFDEFLFMECSSSNFSYISVILEVKLHQCTSVPGKCIITAV